MKFIIGLSLLFSTAHVNATTTVQEAQARAALHQVPLIIQACLDQPALCGVSLKEQLILRALLKTGILDPNLMTITFHSDAEAKAFQRVDRHHIHMARSSLLDDTGVPLKYSELLYQVTLGLFASQSPISDTFAELLAKTILEKITVHTERLRLDIHSNWLYATEVQSIARTTVVLETIHGATDITNKITEKIPCEPEGAVILLGISAVHRAPGFVVGEMRWQCFDHILTGKFKLPVSYDGDKVMSFNYDDITPFDMANEECDDALTPLKHEK